MTASPLPPYDEHRHEMLLRMYDQLMNDINRHLTVIWQSVSVLVGAFALLALAEKNIIPVDIGVSLIILIVGWLLAHLYDAGYWYNRNLVIIANIERQFLRNTDVKDIHCYFVRHRNKNELIEHLKIQYWLGLGIGLIVVVYHYSARIQPWPFPPYGRFEFLKSLPYIVLVLCVIMVKRLRDDREGKYQDFKRKSPGIQVDDPYNSVCS